jgi:glycosyltransferase involved in cell wall biosynthesis
MRILYLCADPGIPLFGRKGCSTHIRETVIALEQLGHQVKIVCSNTHGDSSGESLDVLPIRPPRSRKLGFDLRHMLLDRRLRRALHQLWFEWRPDAIYERYSLYSRAGELFAREHNLPRLMELNAFLTREQAGRIRLGWWARRVERHIIRKAPRVIVVSEPLRQEVHALGTPLGFISKMPMAVNLEKFNPAIDGTATRERLGLTGRFVIGYVGTLAGWHGITLLYDMARAMRERTELPFTFLIVGGDPHKLELHLRKTREQGLQDHLKFIGSVPYDQVPEHIRAFDAAVIPDTTYWSSPAKLFEYQASGVPVLAPRYPAILEALDHGVEGMIFEPREIGAMAEAAIALQQAPEKAMAMGRAARQRAERDHAWRNNAEQIIELYREMGAPNTGLPAQPAHPVIPTAPDQPHP